MNHRKAQSGSILSRLVKECTAAKALKVPFEIRVGLEVWKFLDRITGGKASFMGFPYVQEEGADPLMLRLKKQPKG